MRFAKAMESRTDDELREILTDPADDWEPEAIEAAKVEIAKRGLTTASSPYRTANGREDPLEERNAPGRARMNLNAFFFGFFFTLIGVLVVFAVSANWKRNGEARKAAEWRNSALGGAIVGFLLAMAMSSTSC